MVHTINLADYEPDARDQVDWSERIKYFINHELQQWFDINTYSVDRHFLRYIPVFNQQNIMIYNIKNGRTTNSFRNKLAETLMNATQLLPITAIYGHAIILPACFIKQTNLRICQQQSIKNMNIPFILPDIVMKYQ
jgi:hypothetical protein